MADLHAMSKRWTEISALLDEVLALPSVEQDAWLDALSGESAALRPALRELLVSRARIETGSFLATLPPLGDGVNAAIGAGLRPGQRVGPYRLIAELGQGGMGAVWRAARADGAFAREVALKLPLVNRLRPDLAARFLRERDILARLEHPHIARLYDGGIDDEDGLPYLAMELVEGEPIDRWCDAQHLPLPARIELFLQVLDAVQFAHANLVIHRDLKPSNMLVTAQRQVRLLDFGIAKLLTDGVGAAETELTRLSGRALTPEYASPEQIRGEALTIASDIYSLGVVLYVLLAGQRPYRLGFESAAQLEQAILGVDPPRPSSIVDDAAARARGLVTPARLARALAGDLDTIVLKALAKEPGARYATVAALAQDLSRHLRHEPIEARPAGLGLRLRRVVQRHRAATLGVAGIVLSLGAGLAAALWQAGVARQQVQLANQALGRHEGVRQLLNEMVSNIASWDAAAFAQPRAVPKLVLQKVEELEPQYKERPHDWAGILNAAMVQLNFMGEPEEAYKLALRYIDVLERTDGDVRTLVLAHVSAARNAAQLGRLDDAERFLRKGLARAPVSSDPELATLRVFTSADLGRILAYDPAKRAEGKAVLESARQLGAKYVPKERDYAVLMMDIGRVESGFDNRAAVGALEQSYRIYAANPASENTAISETQVYLGMAYLELGRLDDADKHLGEALAVDLQIYGPADHETLAVIGGQALAAARRERYAHAAEIIAKAEAALHGKAERKYRAMAAALAGRQMEAALHAGDLQAAARALQALDQPEATDPSVPFGHVLPLARSEWLRLSGQPALAQTVLAAYRTSLRPTTPAAARHLIALAEVRVLWSSGDAAGAARAGETLLRTMAEAGVVAAWSLVQAQEWTALASAQAALGERATALLDAAARTRALITPPSSVEQADSELRQADAMLRLGQPAQARALARAALERLAQQHAASPRRAEAQRLIDAAG